MKDLEINNYKVIMLDLWGTLIFDNFININTKRAEILKKHFGKDIDFWLSKINGNIKEYKQYEIQGISKNESQRFKEILQGFKYDNNKLKSLIEEMDNLYLSNLNKIEINHKLDAIFESNKEIILISNSGLLSVNGTVKLLKGLQLYNKFKKIYLSSDYAFCKPNELFYKLPILEFNLYPADILMIGDSFEKDILPCKKLNIETYWIKNDR